MARFLQKGDSIDHKNSGSEDIKYGEIVTVGKQIAVANCDIQQGKTGTISMSGVYEIKAKTEAFDFGETLYFDTENGEVTKTSDGGIVAGLCIEAKDAGSSVAKVRL